jgi:hypothetical protein
MINRVHRELMRAVRTNDVDGYISILPDVMNEAYLMHCYNKTSDWVAKLPLDELRKMVDDVRKGGKGLEAKFKEREKQISLQRREKLKKAAEALVA